MSVGIITVSSVNDQSPNSFVFKGRVVRHVVREGAPWWVAKDVCDVLDQPNHNQVVARLDEDEKGIQTVDTLGGPQEMQCINESGLYSLILTSRKPEAKEFKRWVTRDVLPHIRETGTYAAKHLTQADSTLRLSMIAPEFHAAQEIARLAGIKEDNHVILAADKVMSRVYGVSPLELVDRKHLPAPSNDVHLTPTQIGKELGGKSPIQVNQILKSKGLQIKVAKNWEPTDAGSAYAVVLDTGKRHNTGGTPVTQLKWRSSILEMLRDSAHA